MIYDVLIKPWVWLAAWPLLTYLAIRIADAAGWLPKKIDAHHLGGTVRVAEANPCERKAT